MKDLTDRMWRQPNSHQLRREEARNRKVIKIQASEAELHHSQIVTLHLKDFLKDLSINTCFTFGMGNTLNKLLKLIP